LGVKLLNHKLYIFTFQSLKFKSRKKVIKKQDMRKKMISCNIPTIKKIDFDIDGFVFDEKRVVEVFLSFLLTKKVGLGLRKNLGLILCF
jgi:hypothetical protein